MNQLKQTVGWNTDKGPLCLKCSAKSEFVGIEKTPIIEGLGSGVYCFNCNLKVNRVEKAIRQSLFAKWAKAEKKDPYPMQEPENFYELLPPRPSPMPDKPLRD